MGRKLQQTWPDERGILLTLATLPVGLWPLYDLIIPLSGTQERLDWVSAQAVLVPTWVIVHRDHAELANLSCRNFLLDYMDHNTLQARQCVSRIRSVEQVAGVTSAAGLAYGGTARRPKLAAALIEQRASMISLIRSGLSDEASARTLADAADLLGVYGGESDFTWLAERADGVSGKPVTMMQLAERISTLPASDPLEIDQIASQMVAQAIPLMRTQHELDAYDRLPAALQTARNQELIRAAARRIITGEMEYLITSEDDPQLLRSLAAEADERAAWHGIRGFEITAMLDLIRDRAEDLEAHHDGTLDGS